METSGTQIFHGFISCPIVYLDKQEGTLTTFAGKVQNMPTWTEEAMDNKL